MPDEVQRVLDAIVQRWVIANEERAVELDASAADTGSAIERDKQEAVRREMQRAHDLASAFRSGLVRAWRRARMGGTEVVLDDRDPEENRIADALIHFLVSFDLASSRSMETEENHYVYTIAVDWPRLTAVGREAGVDLERALNRLAGQPAS